MYRFWGRSACLSGFPVVAALMIGVAPAKADLDTPVDFNMPAGDLASTLVAISRQGKVMISFPSEIVAGRAAAALSGRMSARDALLRALAGTGLRLAPGAGGSVTVVRDTAGPSAAAGGDVAAIDVTDESAMSRFGDVGFQAGDAGDTVRIAGAPARQVPLTVNTVTSNVIRSQGLTSAADAVQNVSGVSLNAASGGATSFVIRGFTTTDVYVNGQGVSNTAAGTAGYSQVPIDDIERVEVLKGPSSILGGASSNGGAVNVSTKQPTSTEIRTATVRYGSFNYKTLAFDLGGPIPGTENLTYRFNLAGNHADQGYAGYRDPHEALISPVVKWDNGETSILAGVRYVDQKRAPNQYSFITTDAAGLPSPIIRIPRGTPNVNPDLGYLDRTLTIYSDQSHRFGDIFGFDTTLNNKFQYQESSDRFNYFAWATQAAANAPGGLYRAQQTFGQFNFAQILNKTDLTLSYDAGFAKQTSKFGIDYFQKDINLTTNRGIAYRTNPWIGLPTQPLITDESPLSRQYSEYSSRGVGYYYLEKFDTLEDRLHILGTVRYDTNRFVNGTGFSANRTYTAPTHPEGLSWSAGAVFDLTSYFSIYGNRSTGFVPVLGTVGNTNALPPPETRENWEAGGRLFLFDKKLSVTGSYFNQRASNVSICNPTDPTCTSLLVVGGLDSTGFEMDFQGEVIPGLNLIGSFASTVTKYRDSNWQPPATSIPQYTASLWATYTFQTGLFQGLTFGLGGRGNSNSGTNLSTGGNIIFSVPGYVTADALIGYDYEKWSIQFKINNIFDKYYYNPSFAGNYIGIGQGRNFLLTARYSFD